ncbi:PREDICTED: uncharacterized protein LOC109192494 isoform X2 [Ipomoea nil]|uniref:uncharacterized protein LOC109192494 isoform X2 n=1 Tax=Ipomoea nil TaxID=35883 RepID=UPI000901FC32|nr:PREDICTED: uncharacterized protein LOC109192494 isoform X2 [Ipomoea nil]
MSCALKESWMFNFLCICSNRFVYRTISYTIFCISSCIGAGETNENVLTQGQMNSKLHNHKKPLNRHFISPPMSEASKTAVRGKNILGERNGADSNSGGSKYSGRSSLGVSSQSCASGSNDDEQNSSFVADSSSNQYDPLTNYLSPRPKYLRYKPNRRREIFLHLENRGGEGNDGLGVETKEFVGDEGSMGHAKNEVNVQPENDEILKKGDGDDDSPLPSQEGNAEPENDKIPENEDADDDDNDEAVYSEEEDEDDVEEENGQSFNWLLKLLLLMVIVFLSPLFASLMDYPLSSPTEPAMIGSDDIYPVLGAVPLDVNRSISDSQNKIEASTSSFWELDQGEVGIQADDEVELAEDEEEIFEVAGPENGLNGGSDQELEKEPTEADMVDDKEAEAFDHLAILEPTENKLDAVSAVENEGFGLLKKPEAFDKTDDSCEDHENLEISESLAIPNAAPSEDENFATVIQEFDQMSDENEVVLVEEPTSKASLGETVLETQMDRDEDTCADTDDKISEESDSSNSDGAEKSIYLKLQQIGPTPAALAIASSILSLILAYAISIYSARKARRTSHKRSNPVVEPPQQSNKAEILTAVIPNVEIAHVEDGVDGKRESIAAKVSSSSFYPIQETSKDHPKLFPQIEISPRVEMATQDTIQLHNVYSIEASSLARSVRDSSVELSHTKSLGVELLGELVIGEVSSSLRTHARKTRLPETEESSSNSFSHVSGSRLPPLQPSAFLDSQTSESSSYGRFTTEKKLVKKEGGKDGEAKKVITTPVRRSSRIRSRVMSP